MNSIIKSDILRYAEETIKKELSGINELFKILNDDFINTINILYECKGKIIVTGVGKSGHIAGKIAATLSSTGSPAVFLNPGEGLHGDLGLLSANDVVIAISKSGETYELSHTIPYMLRLGLKIIGISSNPDSFLAKKSTVYLNIGNIIEACPFNLAPTTSTTSVLVLGDALAVSLLKVKGFSEEDFALLHPGGSIGRQLLQVKDLMHTDLLPIVKRETDLKAVIIEIMEKKLGSAIVINDDGTLAGIIVDGDIKRIILKHDNFLHKKAEDVMTLKPKVISPTELVVKALNIMEGKITVLIVVDKGKPVGLLHIHDILKSKIV